MEGWTLFLGSVMDADVSERERKRDAKKKNKKKKNTNAVLKGHCQVECVLASSPKL